MTKLRKRIWLLPLILLLAGGAAALCFALRPVVPLPLPMQLEPVSGQPAGTQLLRFPIRKGTITAGYRNPTYLQKNGYAHYGVDFYAPDVPLADVYASGNGTVVGVELCDNSLGHIAVIRYDDVYDPAAGRSCSLIARYYHLSALSLKTGDPVTAGQVMGQIDSRHQWHNHVHLELDANLELPFNTPQVAEASSTLLNRWPADGGGLLEPLDLLVIAPGQYIQPHPGSDCVEAKDAPRWEE